MLQSRISLHALLVYKSWRLRAESTYTYTMMYMQVSPDGRELIKCIQYDRGLRRCYDLTFCEVKCPRKNWNAGKHTPVH